MIKSQEISNLIMKECNNRQLDELITLCNARCDIDINSIQRETICLTNQVEEKFSLNKEAIENIVIKSIKENSKENLLENNELNSMLVIKETSEKKETNLDITTAKVTLDMRRKSSKFGALKFDIVIIKILDTTYVGSYLENSSFLDDLKNKSISYKTTQEMGLNIFLKSADDIYVIKFDQIRDSYLGERGSILSIVNKENNISNISLKDIFSNIINFGVKGNEKEINLVKLQKPFGDSKIFEEERPEDAEKFSKSLLDFLKEKGVEVGTIELVHRYSDNKYKSDAFHKNTDDKKGLLSIVKTNFPCGNIFGGYNPDNWASPSVPNYSGHKKVTDPKKLFLFSLRTGPIDHPMMFSIGKNFHHAVFVSPEFGPCFGGGSDLFISNNPNESNKSYTHFPSTYIANNNSNSNNNIPKSYLNSGIPDFLVKEIEVFHVKPPVLFSKKTEITTEGINNKEDNSLDNSKRKNVFI